MKEYERDEEVYRVGHTCRDRGSPEHSDDELLRWLRSGGKTIPNAGGIRYREFTQLRITAPDTKREPLSPVSRTPAGPSAISGPAWRSSIRRKSRRAGCASTPQRRAAS